MTEMEYKTVAWWRYPVSVLVFVAIYFLMPLLIGIALTIINWLSPEYYKNSELWIFILSDVFSVICGFYVVEILLVKQKYVFQAIWASIVAVYSFFVGITNWLMRTVSLDQFLGVLAMGVTALVFVGVSCNKNNKLRKSE